MAILWIDVAITLLHLVIATEVNVCNGRISCKVLHITCIWTYHEFQKTRDVCKILIGCVDIKIMKTTNTFAVSLLLFAQNKLHWSEFHKFRYVRIFQKIFHDTVNILTKV